MSMTHCESDRMTEPAWETTKKSYCCLCFSDLVLHFQSYASANISVPPLSFHSFCFPSPIVLPSCLTITPATHPSLLMSVAATAQPKQDPIWNALQTRPGQPLITPRCIDPFLFFHFLSSWPFSLVCPSPPPPEAFLFNLSIPQSPGVSTSPFSWSSVLRASVSSRRGRGSGDRDANSFQIQRKFSWGLSFPV